MAVHNRNTPWQAIAVASGACAAFNGVFAKLTTDELTASWASNVSTSLNARVRSDHISWVIRTVVFVFYFFFSSLMWGLFTRALSLSPSAVHVNIINTSTNFVLTALLGAAIFGERLPPLWWIGAGMLITGSIMIGRRQGAGDINTKRK